MSLKFITKPSRKQPQEIVVKLSEFLHENKIYLDSLFFILGNRDMPITSFEQLEKRIKSNIHYFKIYADKNFKDYLDLLFKFYNTGNRSLEKRRGSLLEQIISDTYNLQNSDFEVIPESIVFDNDEQISPKDIDVIFDGNFVDAIECKAKLRSYLKPESSISKKKKEKLNFMVDVKSRCKKYKRECFLYFATYIKEGVIEQEILERSGFTCFNILSPIEIKERLSVNVH